MLQEDQQVLEDALVWIGAGCRIWLITVVQTWGASPRPVGSWAVLSDDGRLTGSVSGGCVEDHLTERMKAGELDRSIPFFLEYGINAGDAHRFGLPCGGTLKLMVEPAPDPQSLAELATGLNKGKMVARKTDILSGAVTLRPAWPGEMSRLSESHFLAVWGPRWRLLIVGAGQIARYLVPMAQAVGFAVTVVDPRFEAEAAWDNALAPMVRDMPDDVIASWQPDSHSAIVTVSHDPKIDDMALIEALRSDAYFVGAIGSHATQQRRRERLRGFDLDDYQIDRLRGPVGLDIGSRTPPEIAVSIVAALVAERNRLQRPVSAPYAGAQEAQPLACFTQQDS